MTEIQTDKKGIHTLFQPKRNIGNGPPSTVCTCYPKSVILGYFVLFLQFRDMKKTIWLSYDLGVRGDYSSLYSWLDDANAVECGDSLACLKIDIPGTESPPDFVKKQLESNVTFSKSDRVYIVWKNSDGNNKGRFIIGKRKASPWQGYGKAEVDEDDL